ncbi:LysR family transcriptional regulator [Propionibacterium australiense]|uniref:LysR family transcriptional regulator n=1 Tax=Propionibacterium australiense TaxID=119981 RepID=A0A383S4I5_9ACTN|nr:LysR substrate-binding domain-containing protein [Propionibacterium australiense]RLP11487.1 LysR family transcriptional regulator [Propionibacterium australiense]RLP12777.1 LysR family transcriptional regulator [Propionibacterium australiense]SYZ32186.1 Transcription regulator HTH, LysR [Propionibacterium australiense]VEH90723.1 Morphology and auto-aggregation control protein [Propionibacterium australiense]
MRIDPRRLEVLLAVHREGGVVAAAAALSVSASAVSQQLARLEQEAGVAVIERTPSGAVLTPAGRALATSAERIENELEELSSVLRSFAGGATGTIRVGAFPTFINAILLPSRRELARTTPGIELRIAEIEEPEGMAMLRTGHLDVLCLERDTNPETAPPGYADIPVYDEPWVLITPAGTGPITSHRDLDGLTWLRQPAGSAGNHAMERITAPMAHPTHSPHMHYSYSTGVAMVAEGLGATVLPQLALADANRPEVRVTALPGLGVRRLLARHRTRTGSHEPAVEQFLDQLCTWCRRLPDRDRTGTALG